jgi:hypothetical protein
MSGHGRGWSQLSGRATGSHDGGSSTEDLEFGCRRSCGLKQSRWPVSKSHGYADGDHLTIRNRRRNSGRAGGPEAERGRDGRSEAS